MLKPWSIEGAEVGNFGGLERGPHSEGLTGDLKGIDRECRQEEVARNNRAASVIRERLLAGMVEMAARAARKLADNLDEKMCYDIERLHDFLSRLERDIDAYAKQAISVGTGCLCGIGNWPMPPLRAERRLYIKTARRTRRQRRLRLGRLQSNLPGLYARVLQQ